MVFIPDHRGTTPYQKTTITTSTTTTTTTLPRKRAEITTKHHETHGQETTAATPVSEDFGDLLLCGTEAGESNSTCSVDRRNSHFSSMLNYKSKGNSPPRRLAPSVMSVFASVSSKREQLFSNDHQPFTEKSGKLDTTDPVHNVPVNPVNTLAIDVSSNKDQRSPSDTCLRSSTPPSEEVQEEPDKYPCLRRALSCTETPILPLGTYAVEFGFDVSTLPFTPIRQPIYNRPEMAVGWPPSSNYRIHPGLSKVTPMPSVQSVHNFPFPTKVPCSSATRGNSSLLGARISKATITHSRTSNRDDIVGTTELPLAAATSESLPCCSGWHNTMQITRLQSPKTTCGSSTIQNMDPPTNNNNIMGKAESCTKRDSLQHSLLAHCQRPPNTTPVLRPSAEIRISETSDTLTSENWDKEVNPSNEALCVPPLDVATHRVQQCHYDQPSDSTKAGLPSTQWYLKH